MSCSMSFLIPGFASGLVLRCGLLFVPRRGIDRVIGLVCCPFLDSRSAYASSSWS